MVGKDLCTGCEACKSVCPYNCIKMKYDEEGFLQPVIQEELCCHCGKCEKVCPVLNGRAVCSEEKRSCVVGYAIDDEKRMASSSGGIFTLIAECFFKEKGIVYGVAYDEKYRVKHIEVNDMNGLLRLKGSKYVQSRIGNVYKKVKHRLDSGKKVLFSGTGCQIAGLKSYLGKEYENLYCVAIICHGVPSPRIWECYKALYKDAKNINFRDKKFGWKDLHLMIDSNGKKKYVKSLNDPYYHAFMKNIILRKPCYDCKFKGELSQADIMIGDAWGVEFYCRSLDDNKGTSLMIPYTDKGLCMIEDMKPYMKWKEIEGDMPYKYNKRILTSVAYNPQRDKFFAAAKKISILPLLVFFMLQGKWKEKK